MDARISRRGGIYGPRGRNVLEREGSEGQGSIRLPAIAVSLDPLLRGILFYFAFFRHQPYPESPRSSVRYGETR